MFESIDETGNQYGKLKVLRKFGRNRARETTWFRRCVCGNEKPISGYQILTDPVVFEYSGSTSIKEDIEWISTQIVF